MNFCVNVFYFQVAIVPDRLQKILNNAKKFFQKNQMEEHMPVMIPILTFLIIVEILNVSTEFSSLFDSPSLKMNGGEIQDFSFQIDIETYPYIAANQEGTIDGKSTSSDSRFSDPLSINVDDVSISCYIRLLKYFLSKILRYSFKISIGFLFKIF